MAAHPIPLSVEEFHKLYDGAKPAYEYWYGEAVQKSMPTGLHGVLQFVIMMLLDKAGWNAASEVRLKVYPHVEPVPDVIAIRGKFRGSYPTVAPELCIEIMSPGDSLSKALDKAGGYIALGSEWVWIIDPELRTAWTLSRESSEEPAWVAPDGSLQAGETAIQLAVVFAEVDKKYEEMAG